MDEDKLISVLENTNQYGLHREQLNKKVADMNWLLTVAKKPHNRNLSNSFLSTCYDNVDDEHNSNGHEE